LNCGASASANDPTAPPTTTTSSTTNRPTAPTTKAPTDTTSSPTNRPTAPTTKAPTAPTTKAPTKALDCCTSRCRKEWSTLTQTERNLYINGFKQLADQGKIQELSQTHDSSALHGSAYFLPWHRAYIMVLEDAIRALPGYQCFAMPYWDWTNEPTPLEVSEGETLVIMSSGLGDDSDGECQNSGSVFDEGKYEPQSSSYRNSNGQKCMVRNVDYTAFATSPGVGYCWFATPSDIMSLIGGTNRYETFDGGLEYGSGMHGSVHICISGNMGTFYSPDDPVFWLHHTFIDYIWALWQDCWDYEGVTPTPTQTLSFSGSLTATLSFSPYTTRTYTPQNVLDLSSYSIIYEDGPLFSNVVVDASSNCPGTVNPNWFASMNGKVRRLRENKRRERNKGRNNRIRKRKRIKFKPFKKLDKRLQTLLSQPDELEIEVEECDNGRNACPIPDYFEDCSFMTDDEINALTIQDIISMDGLNECQIATREQEYQFAKNFNYLRALCNGCMDPVCDHSIYYKKCSVDNDRDQNVMAIQSPNDLDKFVQIPYNPNEYIMESNVLTYFMTFVCISLICIIIMICMIGMMVYRKFYYKENYYASKYGHNYDKAITISTDNEDNE